MNLHKYENKYKTITPSTIAECEINIALTYDISFETINRCSEFILDPALIASIAKLPCKPPQYQKVIGQNRLYFRVDEGYEAHLITEEKVVCEYLQTDIESGEIRSCILVDQKEIPIPIPQGNFFIVKAYYEQANKNIESQ